MFSILTQIFHTTLDHVVNFIVEIKKKPYGTETISSLAPKTWSSVSEAIKGSKLLDDYI